MRNVLIGSGLMLVCVILLTGCGQTQQTSQVNEHGIQATIQTDCIVHYYKSNAANYITRQRHGYNPAEGFFHSVSAEPTGIVECTLLKDYYSYSGQEMDSLSDLPHQFWNRDLATSVFYSFCGSGGLIDLSSMTPGDNVKVEGQWYRPFIPSWPNQFNIILYQSLDTNRVELVQMEDSQQGRAWLLRSYNYRYSKELEKTLPRTIDAFDIQDGIASKLLMIRFEGQRV